MTRCPLAAKNLFIGFGQPVKEAAERAFGLEVLYRIFFKGLFAAFGTEIVASALMCGYQIGGGRANLHATYRIQGFSLCVNCHDNVLVVFKLLNPWQRYTAARERKRFDFLK
jgi:hypothetical protein